MFRCVLVCVPLCAANCVIECGLLVAVCCLMADVACYPLFVVFFLRFAVC